MKERAVGMLQECPSGRRLQRRFKEFGSTSKRPHNCRPRATTPACNSLGLHNQRISACTIPAKLIHMLVSTCLQFVVKATRANTQIRWQLALGGGFFTGGWAVCRWIGWLMVALGLWFRQWTQAHLIDGIMKTQRFRDQILRPIVAPLLTHSPVFQGPLRSSRTSQFLQGWKIDRTCPLSLFGMLWIRVDDSIFQFLPISSNFPQPVKRTNIPQTSISNLINAKEMCFTAWGNWWSNQILREIGLVYIKKS